SGVSQITLRGSCAALSLSAVTPWRAHEHWGATARSRAGQPRAQVLLHRWPLRRQDGEARRVARGEIGGQPVRAQHPLELRADALERRARALVAHVGVKANAPDVPR